MKILLVNPEFPETYWSFRHALPFEGKRCVFPPLGLLTVSSLLPQSCERRLVDLNIEPLKDSQIEWADMIFITGMLAQKQSLHEVVKRSKQRGKLIVLGGPYVTSTIEELPYADHIFQGEAETTLPQFFKDLESGEAKRTYKAPERPPLALTPIPDFGLVNLKDYSNMCVQYSRGCPFSCEFCDIIEIYGRVPRTKSNQQMLAELDALRAVGWRGLVFIAEASVNLAEDDALLDAMRRANFRRVFLGIETPVEESLKEAQKGQNTRRDLLESVHRIQSYGMEVMAGFIVGFDSDPEDIFDRQINFIRESAIPLAMVGLLTALPDTQLWRRLKKEGRLLHESSGNNTEGTLNFVPRMDTARLIEGYKRILSTIYSPAEYYQRALDCLSHLTQGPEPRKTRLTSDLAAFARIAFVLGLLDGARMDFWRYMKRTLTEHRQNFAHAVTLAAMGYHFRKLTRSYVE